VRLYRVTSNRYVTRWQDAFSGEGSFRGGGRWSSVGTRMVYTSTHLSLAALEVLVHCNRQSFLDSRLSIRFDLDDRYIQRLERLPEAWNSIPESINTQRLGDSWIEANSAAGLIVPSATLPQGDQEDEYNVLLNPSFPNFLNLLKNASVKAFDFDTRITSLVTN
jgi:RES domain-containing protein